ncbi:reductase [Segetibacter sp. 3557_3]|uniref:dihydrofolate reductase family protein n=1 Tax=Segetibacter sp. 3557_3 TaxID=2547429 RepID=UPI0010589D5D|nr:dihydrofolate reductase family protein [Segetibacter sp. 3557_3]TDH26806.1 reductase [Segetibacter sp. 3557_3]
MRKLIVQEWLSLDGFVADKNGNLDFFTTTEYSEKNKYSDYDLREFMIGIDTILLGRITYELFVDFWPTADVKTEVIADVLNTTQKVVCSNSITKAPWGKWPDAQILNGDVVTSVQELKSREGKNIVMWGSIMLAQTLIKAGLVDAYHLRICPTVTGGGRPFFPGMSAYVNLNLVECKKYPSGTILLQYEPLKP